MSRWELPFMRKKGKPMKPEVKALCQKDSNGNVCFNVLAIPSKGQITINLAKDNALGALSLTIDNPFPGVIKSVGSRVVLGEQGVISLDDPTPIPRAPEPQQTRTSGCNIRVNDGA